MTGVVRDRAFRLLWGGTAVSKLGSSVAGVATPLIAVQVLDASAFTVSLLTAATWLPWLVIGLPAGAWVDRIAKRPVMIACDLAAALLVLSVPAAAWFGQLTVAHLLAVALLLGTATVFFQVAWTSYLPALLDRDRLVPANAVLSGTESATQVAGPALGGVLIAATGGVAGLVADAVSFVVSAVCLLRIRRPERRPSVSARPGVVRDIRAGVRYVARDAYLRCLTLHGAAGNFALTGYQAVLIVFLVRDVGVGTAAVGLLLAASSLGGVVSAAAVPLLVRRLGTARTLVVCKAGAGVCALLIPLTQPGPGLLAFLAGNGLVAAGVVAGNVVSGSFRQSYCPPELLGRVLTTMQFVNLGTIPLGAVAAGLLATATGTRGAIAVMAAVYAASGLILVLGPLRGRRDMPMRAFVSERSECPVGG